MKKKEGINKGERDEMIVSEKREKEGVEKR